MKQLEFVFDPNEISFSQIQRHKEKYAKPCVTITKKDGRKDITFTFRNLEQLGDIRRATPGIFEKFGIKRLVFRIGDGYKLSGKGNSKVIRTSIKAEQYADFIGTTCLVDIDSAGEYLFAIEGKPTEEGEE